MPKISSYPRLHIQILGDFLEITENYEWIPKVVGYVHMKELDELALLSFAEEFITQARKKAYAKEDPELEKKMANTRSQLYNQSSLHDDRYR
jgi:hypothetical protein